jgi:hypothetical protein
MRFFAALLLSSVAVFSAPPTVTDPTVEVSGAGSRKFKTFVTTNGGGTTNVIFRYGIDAALDKSTAPKSLSELADAQEVLREVIKLVGGQNYGVQAEATNQDGTTKSAVVIFNVPKYAPTITDLPAKPTPGGKVTLGAKVTANGSDTQVVFVYGTTTDVYPNSSSQSTVTANLVDQEVFVEIEGLERGLVYHYRARATNDDGTTQSPNDLTFVATPNQAPRTVADNVTLRGSEPILVDVLKNDRDPEGDAFNLIAVSPAKQGKVEIVGNQIKYTPGNKSTGPEVITYTVRDNYLASPQTATGTLTIRAPGLAAQGTHAVQLTDADGNVIGILRLNGTSGGQVTGKLDFFDQKYQVSGTLDENGRFHVVLPRKEDGPLDLTVTFDQSGESTALEAFLSADGNEFSGEAPLGTFSKERRKELVGTYTMEIPAPGGGGTDTELPGGTGFMRIQVSEWGGVTFKGKLGDGTKFSGSSVLSGTDAAPVIPYWLTPENSRIGGTITIGSGENPTLASVLKWYRGPDGDAQFFPDGFFVESSASGAKYQLPDEGRRALSPNSSSINKATLSLSNGNLASTITYQYDISKGDRLDLLDAGSGNPSLKIDRKKGIFKGEFDHPLNGSRQKFEGVLLQQSEVGRGVFIGINQTGTVEFKLEAIAPTPVPTPTPTPTPNPNPPTTPGIDTGGIDFGGIDLGGLDF